LEQDRTSKQEELNPSEPGNEKHIDSDNDHMNIEDAKS